MESRQENAKLSILKLVSDHVKLALHLVNPSSASLEKTQQAAGDNTEGCPFLCGFFLAAYCHTCNICPFPQIVAVQSVELKQLKEKNKR